MKLGIVFCFGLLLGIVSGAFLASFIFSLNEEAVTYRPVVNKTETSQKNPVKKNGVTIASKAVLARPADIQTKPAAIAAEPVDLDLDVLSVPEEPSLTTVKRDTDSSEIQ